MRNNVTDKQEYVKNLETKIIDLKNKVNIIKSKNEQLADELRPLAKMAKETSRSVHF